MREVKLTKDEEHILAELYSDSEMCLNYSWLTGERKELELIIKRLKELDYIEFHRGLMTEDGQVAGSGWCRSELGNKYVEDNQL